MIKNRKLWWVVAGAIALGGGAYFLFNDDDNKITYRTAKVDRGDVSVVISATGTLNAVTTVQVGSQVSGTIAKLYADFNTKVNEGQLLAQLDPTFLQASVSEQNANVDRAQAQVNEAERTFKRTSELFEKSLVSQADMDAARTGLESAKASLAQSKAALERASVNLRYATIKAPISGVVISRNVDVGQTVAASLQAPTLFTIANDLRKMQVQASVDEADIGNVKEGQEVTFRVDSYPEETFTGAVSQIRLAPVVTQNVVTYSVIIDVNNRELKLMPGMTATVSIEVATTENVLRVPVQASRFTPPVDEGDQKTLGERENKMASRDGAAIAGGTNGVSNGKGNPALRDKSKQRAEDRVHVWILENGKPKAVAVRKGLQNARFMELVEAELKEGDEVIVGMTGGAQTQQQVGTNNPFAPRIPGGGGGGRRGGM